MSRFSVGQIVDGSFSTMQALQIVLKEEQSHAMTEVLREMERARMTAEDRRGALGKVGERIVKVSAVLREVRNIARMASECDIERVPHRKVHRTCMNTMIDVMEGLGAPDARTTNLDSDDEISDPRRIVASPD